MAHVFSTPFLRDEMHDSTKRAHRLDFTHYMVLCGSGRVLHYSCNTFFKPQPTLLVIVKATASGRRVHARTCLRTDSAD